MSSSFSGPFLTFAVLVCICTCCGGVSFSFSFISSILVAAYAEYFCQGDLPIITAICPSVDGECTTARVQMRTQQYIPYSRTCLCREIFAKGLKLEFLQKYLCETSPLICISIGLCNKAKCSQGMFRRIAV